MTITCPLCKHELEQPAAECPNCRADLSLLADFQIQLQGGLARAETLTRQGQLGEAIWTYLEVLEVDPENAAARAQVARVAAAVRQFDEAQRRRFADRRSWIDVPAAVRGLVHIGVLLVVLGLVMSVYRIGVEVGQGRSAGTAARELEKNQTAP